MEFVPGDRSGIYTCVIPNKRRRGTGDLPTPPCVSQGRTTALQRQKEQHLTDQSGWAVFNQIAILGLDAGEFAVFVAR